MRQGQDRNGLKESHERVKKDIANILHVNQFELQIDLYMPIALGFS